MMDYHRQPIRATNDEDAYNLFEKIKNHSGICQEDGFYYAPNLFGFALGCTVSGDGYIIDDENFIVYSEEVNEAIEGIVDIHILYFTNYHSLERMLNKIIEKIRNDETFGSPYVSFRYYAHPDVSIEQLKLFGFEEMEAKMPMYMCNVVL